MMSVHLFTSHFNWRNNKYLLRFIEIAALLCCLVVTEKVLEYFVVVKDGFTKLLMDDFYGMEDNIDNLYLGSSHVHYNIQPELLDEITGENNFSLSTGLQPMTASYFLLREACRKNELKHVYLEISAGLVTGEYGNIKNYEQLPNTWRVMNYVHPSINKLEWMLDSSDPKYYYLTFFPAVRYHKELLSGQHIAGRLQEKLEDESTAWNGGYRYKGYRWSNDTVKEEDLQEKQAVFIGEDPISPIVVEYLEKIMRYCQKNKIELTAFTAPIADCEMAAMKDYVNFDSQMEELTEKYGMQYMDFNLCKQEYLDLTDSQLWRDTNHLNEWGSEVFTSAMGKIFEAEKSGNSVEQYFYESYAQKLADQ